MNTKQTLNLIALLLALSFNASACEVKSFFWKPTGYSTTVIRLHLNMSGCGALQQVDIKLYAGDEWIGSSTVYTNTAVLPIDISRAIKSNQKLRMETSVHNATKIPG